MPDGYPPPVRLNRYLAAAGLGNRREVEGYVRAGQVRIDGLAVLDPARRVTEGEEVLLNGTPVLARPTAAVALHKPVGVPARLVHPVGLHVAVPLLDEAGGLEIALGDERVALRLADPRHPAPALWRGAVRTRLAGVDLGDLGVGEWRPLAPRELEGLRRSVRLPPRAEA